MRAGQDPILAYVESVDAEARTGYAGEHSYRPALKTLLEALGDRITATNEPKKHVDCGLPDFVVTRGPLIVGYVEAKDLGADLARESESDQLLRYRRSLGNVLLTNYLEFRWFVDGEPRGEARLASAHEGRVRGLAVGAPATALLREFLEHEPAVLAHPRPLAERLARLAHIMSDAVAEAFRRGAASADLSDLRDAFAEGLLPELADPGREREFADMYAQTLAYGLFAARCNCPDDPAFERRSAAAAVPPTNPLLRRLFESLTGAALDGEPHRALVEDLVQTLAHTDMAAILAHFGSREGREDPVFHFYETFLAAYDPALREQRGVYYTPEPVVSYIVRAVDHVLRDRLGVPDGLADDALVEAGGDAMDEAAPTRRLPRVLVLDPACGTGTFLYHVVAHIRRQFMDADNAGMWAGHVQASVLPMLYGFELLMAPYAMAHLKLSLALAARDLPVAEQGAWGYDFQPGERINVFLTNTLDEPLASVQRLPGPLRVLSEEAEAAARVKRDLPIMVVLGNPPYSNFGRQNRGAHIARLLEDYKRGLGERKLNLDDDFIKFVRWGQWRVEATGRGVLAFITNGVYLSANGHRRMRERLLEAFDDIYILNLHGDSRGGERPPDGVERDDNVFEIRQGVAIAVYVRTGEERSRHATVHYADLWGTRAGKYAALRSLTLAGVEWRALEPEGPDWLFTPSDGRRREEWDGMVPVTDLFRHAVSGVQTHRDRLVVAFGREELRERLRAWSDSGAAAEEVNARFGVRATRGWDPEQARQWTRENLAGIALAAYHYRPMDVRWLAYEPELTQWPRSLLREHVAGADNILLLAGRGANWPDLGIGFVSRSLPDKRCLGGSKTEAKAFPLYLYQHSVDANGQRNGLTELPWPADSQGRVANLEPEALKTLGLGGQKPDAETVLAYVYAILSAPSYAERYAPFLCRDYPRVPTPRSAACFRDLAKLGRELIAAHTFTEGKVGGRTRPSFPVPGPNDVARAHPVYDGDRERVYINRDQYFAGVEAEVWEHHICGYQVCREWLKERVGRGLDQNDLRHYAMLVRAVRHTVRLQVEIDGAIEAHGGWPLGSA